MIQTFYGTGTIPSKKNSKQIFKTRSGKPFISSSNAYIKWENATATEMSCKLKKVIQTCLVRLTIYPADNKRFDLDNKITGVLDALVNAGILEDDSWKCVRGITAVVDKSSIDTKGKDVWILTIETI